MTRATPRQIWLVLFLGVFVVSANACSGCFGGAGSSDTDNNGEATAKTTGTNVDSPLSALSALSNMANDVQSLQAEIASMEPVDPVHFSVLIEALPLDDNLPDGWTSDTARGESNRMGDFSMSVAHNTYRHEDGSSMEVRISDFAHNQIAYSGFAMSAAFSQESTEGYNRGITVGDDPGREEYEYADRSGSRDVLYGKRYLVHLDGRNVEPEAFDQWYARVATGSLPLD